MSTKPVKVVFTAEEVAEALEAAFAADQKILDENPGKTPESLGFVTTNAFKDPLDKIVGPNALAAFYIDYKPDAKEFSHGTKYFKNMLNIPHKNLKTGVVSMTNAECWIRGTGLKVTKAPADPKNAEDPRNIKPKAGEAPKNTLSYTVESRVSRAGAMGRALVLMNYIFWAHSSKLHHEGKVKLHGRQFHEIIQTRLSEKNKDKPNGKIEDEPVRFACSFETHNPKHPDGELRGKPRTTIRQYCGMLKDKVVDKTPTVVDPVTGNPTTLNRDNIHMYLQRGVELVRYEIYVDSTSMSQGWWSAPVNLHSAIVNPSVAAELEGADEVINGDDSPPEALDAGSAPAPVTTPVTTPAPAPVPVTTQSPTPAPASESEINSLLDSLVPNH